MVIQKTPRRTFVHVFTKYFENIFSATLNSEFAVGSVKTCSVWSALTGYWYSYRATSISRLLSWQCPSYWDCCSSQHCSSVSVMAAVLVAGSQMPSVLYKTGSEYCWVRHQSLVYVLRTFLYWWRGLLRNCSFTHCCQSICNCLSDSE